MAQKKSFALTGSLSSTRCVGIRSGFTLVAMLTLALGIGGLAFEQKQTPRFVGSISY